jgi:hypothetical protein
MRKEMKYEVGYLYQTSDDGRTWANGFGPIKENLRIVSRHTSLREALAAGAKMIGSPSPMGQITDAYLVRRTSSSRRLLGEIRADGTLDEGVAQ